MKKLQKLQAKLQAAGLEVAGIVLNIDGAEVPALSVNTDYDGPYPPRETFQKLETVRKMSRGYTVEPRGHYVSVFVY